MSENQEQQENAPEENQNEGGEEAQPRSSGPKIDRFYRSWDRFSRKPPPPKYSSISSLDLDIEDSPSHHPHRNREGAVSRTRLNFLTSEKSENAAVSFKEAAATCKAKVDAIVNECRRINIKYFDPTFNLGLYDTLASLAPGNNPSSVDSTVGVGAVRRVEDIFENPRFIKDGATANDIRQGNSGDCWFLAAVTALSGTEEPDQTKRLLTKLCVKRDEQVGVYGFVFYRDGEWVSEVVDDRLCQRHAAENQKQFICRIPADKSLGQMELKASNFELLPRTLKDTLNKGSDTLFFSSCRDSDETWLPLLEKAYAKAHGDYQSIEAGLTGEGIEDMTGGVNNSMDSEDILDKDKLWKELLRVNQDFLFGCSSRRGTDEDPADVDGFVRGHAYTVLEAREFGEARLLKIRNPWGRQEWNGAWSDGSKEWTPEALQELGHTFGDDGMFWIAYKDFLTYYPRIDRTRLFGPKWTVSLQWTSVNVSLHPSYQESAFKITIHKPGPVVIVLSQPDSRYFLGFEGRYRYNLSFRVYRDGESTYLLRSMGHSGTGRSCSAELDATPGTYTILLKITANRLEDYPTPDETIQKYQVSRRNKLLSVGKSYDMVHSKGLLREKENKNAAARKQDSRRIMIKKESKLLKAQRLWKQEAKRRRKLQQKRIEDARKLKMEAKAALKVKQQEVQSQDSEDNESDEGLENGAKAEAGKKGVDMEAGSQPNKSDAGSNVGGNQDSEEEQDQEQDASDISEVDEVDFDWDSDIDGPVIPPIEASDDEDEYPGLYSEDPWNAACVIGLRVHSMDQETKIAIVDVDSKPATEVA